MNQSIKDSIIENQQHVYTDIHEAMIETKRTVTGRLVRQELNNINMADTSTLQEHIRESQDILTQWATFMNNDITEMTMPSIVDFWKANYPSNTTTSLIIPQLNAINYYMYALLQKQFENFNNQNEKELILTLDYVSAKPSIKVEIELQELEDIVTFQSASAKYLTYTMTNDFRPDTELAMIDRKTIEADILNAIDHNINGKVYYSFIDTVLSKVIGYNEPNILFHTIASCYRRGYIFETNMDIDLINIEHGNNDYDDKPKNLTGNEFMQSRYVAHYLSSHTIMDTLDRIIENLMDQTENIRSLMKQKKSIIHRNKINALQKEWKKSNQIVDLDDRYARIKELYMFAITLQKYLETEKHIPQLHYHIERLYSSEIDRIEQNINKVRDYLVGLHLS